MEVRGEKGYSQFTRIYVYISVVLSGIAVMVLEILSSRLLSPYFGSGIYVWTSSISITLLGLAIGYYLAGKLLDRIASTTIMGGILTASAFSIALQTFLFARFANLVAGLELRLAVVLASLFLLFVPMVFLGTVTILASTVIYKKSHHFGNSVGNVFAVSTVTGITGAIVSGFLLVTLIGSKKSILLIAALLLVWGLVGLIIYMRRHYIALYVIIVVGCVPLVVFGDRDRMDSSEYKLFMREESPYGEIIVLEDEFKRYLFSDRILQTEEPLFLDAFWEPGLLIAGGNYLELIPYRFQTSGDSVLIVGLGGGVLAKVFGYYQWRVDAIEIDPVIADVAEKYFGYVGPVEVIDGRYYLERNAVGKFWDAIILDVFSGESIPSHLYTEEMFRLCRDRLSDSGIVGLNYFGTIESQLTASLFRTLKQVFPYVSVYAQGKDRQALQFLFFFASRTDFDDLDIIHLPGGSIVYLRKIDFTNTKLENSILLTDDRNPINVLRSQEALLWRRMTQKRFPF
jgi:spermidine synthase